MLSLQYKRNNTELIVGGGYDRYDGKHYGYVTWAANGGFPDDYRYYYEPAIKIDYNVYAKWQQQFGQRWTGFADLQWRHLDYELDGFDDNPAILVHPKYNFVNPKAGITYTHYSWQAYFSYAMAGHEPNRNDFEAGINEQPKPERLHDFELGLQRRGLKYSWAITGYYMLYHNQLVLTGRINDVGDYTRSNIARSYRLGIELQGSAKPVNWLSVDANLALSRNKAYDYVEYDNNYDNGGQVSHAYHTTDIAFSPAVVGGATLNFMPVQHFTLSLPAKYVSKKYLDNAQQENRKLDGYYVQNLRAVYTITNKLSRETDIIFQLNNVFNKRYTPNGYTTSYIYGGALQTDNFVFPMAGTNFMVAVNIKL